MTESLPLFYLSKPEIGKLVLCGSTRFKDQFELWNKRLTLAGFLVYSVSGFDHADVICWTDDEKARLDQVHKAKIDASHGIVVLNVGGYIGESTASELSYAIETDKEVFFLENGRTVYQLRTGSDGVNSLRYRAFDWGPSCG